jgi:hypothetical protein
MTSNLMKYVASSALSAIFSVGVAATASAAPIAGPAFQPQVHSSAPVLQNAYWVWHHRHRIWVRPHHNQHSYYHTYYHHHH